MTKEDLMEQKATYKLALNNPVINAYLIGMIKQQPIFKKFIVLEEVLDELDFYEIIEMIPSNIVHNAFMCINGKNLQTLETLKLTDAPLWNELLISYYR